MRLKIKKQNLFLTVLIGNESDKTLNLKSVLRFIRILNSMDDGHSRGLASIWGFRNPQDRRKS